MGPDGRLERITGATGSGLALGMFDQATYDTNRVTIEPGDLLVLYTDGITEAENPQGEAFDDAGLEGVVARTWTSDPQQIGRALLTDVERFAGDARLADDLTALVLKRGAVPGAATAEAAG